MPPLVDLQHHLVDGLRERVETPILFGLFAGAVVLTLGSSAGSWSRCSLLRAAFGGGLTVDNWLGGRFADRSVDRTLIVTLASLSAILLAFAALMPHAGASAVLIFLWGVASFALVPPLQVRVMTAAADAPNLASAVHIGAFNLGNASGAALGGGVIAAGLGYPAVAIAGAATSAIELAALLFANKRVARKDRACADA